MSHGDAGAYPSWLQAARPPQANHSHTFRLIGSLDQLVDLHMFLCRGRKWSTRGNPRRHWENMQSPSRKAPLIDPGTEPMDWTRDHLNGANHCTTVPPGTNIQSNTEYYQAHVLKYLVAATRLQVELVWLATVLQLLSGLNSACT